MGSSSEGECDGAFWAAEGEPPQLWEDAADSLWAADDLLTRHTRLLNVRAQPPAVYWPDESAQTAMLKKLCSTLPAVQTASAGAGSESDKRDTAPSVHSVSHATAQGATASAASKKKKLKRQDTGKQGVGGAAFDSSSCAGSLPPSAPCAVEARKKARVGSVSCDGLDNGTKAGREVLHKEIKMKEGVEKARAKDSKKCKKRHKKVGRGEETEEVEEEIVDSQKEKKGVAILGRDVRQERIGSREGEMAFAENESKGKAEMKAQRRAERKAQRKTKRKEERKAKRPTES
mmetsp:Transcript_16244/g.34842  ORF Transcript_16244/g.34842 Transcript_16244/m.34842 type:complete len:289 (-) Transcript_16244:137-1003(-)